MIESDGDYRKRMGIVKLQIEAYLTSNHGGSNTSTSVLLLLCFFRCCCVVREK